VGNQDLHLGYQYLAPDILPGNSLTHSKKNSEKFQVGSSKLFKRVDRGQYCHKVTLFVAFCRPSMSVAGYNVVRARSALQFLQANNVMECFEFERLAQKDL